MSELFLRQEREGAVLRLVLNRPDDMNALSSGLVRELGAALEAVEHDPGVRIVVLTGAGKAFCAGADLKEARIASVEPERMTAWLSEWRQTFRRLEELPKPVIAAINGLALAGGLELALACDVLVASRTAKIGDVHIRYGLVPGGGGSQRLPSAVGSRWARWLMYTGAILDAEQALHIGLVQAVLDGDRFEDEVRELAATMAARSAAALAFMKRMTAPSIPKSGYDRELAGSVELVMGPDAREGFAAFVEKREPRFNQNASP